ncbi:oxygenase MpaB family protein [Mycobacterium sp. NPDC050853]|uniref:oxygenase MpaB family protein n=1 Tax=Mycobacterium sp. NPDC050853 TaxID=3155160 RepID=UPI0033F91D6F
MTVTAPAMEPSASVTALERRVFDRIGVPSRELMRFLDWVGARPTEAQLATFRTYTKMGDALADDLVAAMSTLPKGLGRKQFNDALDHGIETVEDPLPELVAFIREAESTPYWVDFRKIARAQRALRDTPVRLSFVGSLAVTLPASFLNERGGNELLARAGGVDNASAARLVDAASWMFSCGRPGGMDRFGDGFKATVRVRLIHAYARQGARRAADWDDDALDCPAGQAQTAAGWVPILAGSLSLVAFGAIGSPADLKAVLHLWRYQSHLMGVRPELQVDSLTELARLAYLILLTDGGSDHHTGHLTHATLDAVPEVYGLPRSGPLVGTLRWAFRRFHAEIAGIAYGRQRKKFDLPAPSPLLLVVPFFTVYNLAAAGVRRLSPAARARFERRQSQILDAAIERTRPKSILEYARP